MSELHKCISKVCMYAEIYRVCIIRTYIFMSAYFPSLANRSIYVYTGTHYHTRAYASACLLRAFIHNAMPSVSTADRTDNQSERER